MLFEIIISSNSLSTVVRGVVDGRPDMAMRLYAQLRVAPRAARFAPNPRTRVGEV